MFCMLLKLGKFIQEISMKTSHTYTLGVVRVGSVLASGEWMGSSKCEDSGRMYVVEVRNDAGNPHFAI